MLGATAAALHRRTRDAPAHTLALTLPPAVL